VFFCLFYYVGQGRPSVAGAMDGAEATGTLCRFKETANHYRLILWVAPGRYRPRNCVTSFL